MIEIDTVTIGVLAALAGLVVGAIAGIMIGAIKTTKEFIKELKEVTKHGNEIKSKMDGSSTEGD